MLPIKVQAAAVDSITNYVELDFGTTITNNNGVITAFRPVCTINNSLSFLLDVITAHLELRQQPPKLVETVNYLKMKDNSGHLLAAIHRH
ncbi:MAG: hypothetical protein ACJAW3_001114 [Lentimonas sp.]